jgi:hypothetical protein
MHRTTAHRGSSLAWPHANPLVLFLLAALLAPWRPAVCQGPDPAEHPRADRSERDDWFRKATILNGVRWRRAVFELDEWLADQPVYSPDQVRRIRADFDRRVAEMSSYELEYLLDSLDAKIQILSSPEAMETRQWLGRYLSVMADARRAEVLRDLPDVLTMTAAELAEAIRQVDEKRVVVERHRRDSLRTQRAFAARIAAGHRAIAAHKARVGAIRLGEVAFSPYRGQPVGDPPFPVVGEGEPFLTVGQWGVAMDIDVGAF